MSYFKGDIRPLGSLPHSLFAPLHDLASRKDWCDIKDKPNDYPVFRGTTSHLVFLFPATGERDHRLCRAYNDWHAWKSVVQPIMAWAANAMGIADWRPCRAMLANLHAGKAIALHTDFIAPSAYLPHKIHVPLITDEQVVFRTERTERHLATGHAYEVNNAILHGGRNSSSIDRIHLIFELWDQRTDNVRPVQFDDVFAIQDRIVDPRELGTHASEVQDDPHLPSYDLQAVAGWLSRSGRDFSYMAKGRRSFCFTFDSFIDCLRRARTPRSDRDPRLDIVSGYEILQGLLHQQIVVPGAWLRTSVRYDPTSVVLGEPDTAHSH